MITTYTYRKKTGPAWEKHLTVYKLKVEILEDLGQRVRVKFLDYHVDGRGPGTITAVAKKNLNVVRPASTLPAPGPRPDHYRDPYND